MRRRWAPWLYALIILVGILLLAASARAQTPKTADQVNYASVVAAVKADLEQRGVPLAGPCGAFEIVKRVAWQQRTEGAGLLDKPGGNNCAGFAVDIIAFPNGSIANALVDSGGANGPSWQVGTPVDAARYRAAIDPGDTPTPPDPPPADNLAAILLRLEARLAALESAVKQLPSSPLAFPVYEGSIRIPYIGSAPVTLTPKQ